MTPTGVLSTITNENPVISAVESTSLVPVVGSNFNLGSAARPYQNVYANNISGTVVGPIGPALVNCDSKGNLGAQQISGTTNQVNITGTIPAALTFSLPQDIATTSIPSFNSIIVLLATASQPLKVNASKQIISGLIDLKSDITNILPIANGGTNSTTALNNNRIMMSSGGAIVEASALGNGQLLIGATGSAPTAANLTQGSNIIITNAANSITIAVTATPTFTTLATTGAATIGSTLTATGTISGSNLSGTNTGDITITAAGSTPNANGASLSGQALTLQPADGSNPGILTATTQTIGGAKTFSSTIAASNLSGTNTGDISITAVGSTPNANGASLSGQALTLQPASSTQPGLITAGTQTIGGAKTFSSTIAASNLSGTNTGDVTLAAVGSTPNANGASLAGQALTLQPADGSNPGLITAAAQTIGGVKTFSSTISATNLSGTNTGDVTLAAVGSTPNANGASLAGQTLTLQPASGTQPGLITAAAQTIGGAKTFSSTISASNLSGTNTGDVTLSAVGSTPNANGASLSGQALTLQPANGTNPGLITAGTQTIGGAKTFSSTIAASNLSGTNTGDISLAAVGSAPNGNGASLSGQVLTLQPADASNPGLITTGNQIFTGKKAFNNPIISNLGVQTAYAMLRNPFFNYETFTTNTDIAVKTWDPSGAITLGITYDAPTGQLTVPATGMYSITATLKWNAPSGIMYMYFFVNGSGVQYGATNFPPNTYNWTTSANIYMTAGDKVAVYGNNQSGSNQQVTPINLGIFLASAN